MLKTGPAIQGRCFFLAVLLAAGLQANGSAQSRFTKGQELVIAAFQLDVEKVEALLAAGVDVNSRMGIKDQHVFDNKWTLGYSPMGSDKWTPLLAVLNSHREPEPAQRTKNTVQDREAAFVKMREIDPRLIRDRDERRFKIAKRLISAGADLDLDDGHGSTALATATAHESIALLLIESGAKINTKTGLYIDGRFDFTPVHTATWNPKILAALLKHGGKVDAVDSHGETPLHWAARDRHVASIKLLLAADADPNVKDKKGRRPVDWCETYPGDPKRAEKETIQKLLNGVAE